MLTSFSVPFVLNMLVGLLFIIVGLPLWKEKVPQNSFYGFRTSSTLNNERLWFMVNKRTGLDMIISGIFAWAGTLLIFFFFEDNRFLQIVPIVMGPLITVIDGSL